MKQPKRRHVVSDVQHSRIVSSYRNGLTLREIADVEEVAYGTVHRHLVRAGVVMRTRGGSVRRPLADGPLA